MVEWYCVGHCRHEGSSTRHFVGRDEKCFVDSLPDRGCNSRFECFVMFSTRYNKGSVSTTQKGTLSWYLVNRTYTDRGHGTPSPPFPSHLYSLRYSLDGTQKTKSRPSTLTSETLSGLNETVNGLPSRLSRV